MIVNAAGYQIRLVQAHAHVSAEIFYDGGWRYFEVNLAGGPPIKIDGSIPSFYELAKSPFLIDRVPTRFADNVSPGRSVGSRSVGSSTKYPSYNLFSSEH